MMKSSKVSINLLLGVVIGMIAFAMTMFQTKLLIAFLMSEAFALNYKLVRLAGALLGGVIFYLIVRGFLKIKGKKLSLYFILSMIIAVGGALFSWTFIFFLLNSFLTPEQLQSFTLSDYGMILTSIGINLVIITVFLIFFLIFMSLINRKVKYINYISSEIKRIEREGFGLMIQEYGNDELTDLSHGINSMSLKLKEKIEYEKKLEQAKNELITNVSHDLRTPLTSIIGYVNLLKQNGFKDREKFDEYIEVVERRINGLNVLINELFEYTKLNSSEQKLQMNKMDFIPMLTHLLDEYEYIYINEDLKLIRHISSENCNVIMDADKMIRVFQNLLDNARKYAKRNSSVIIETSQEDDWVNISITNEIEGDKSLDMDQLFERFYKADAARSRTDSSGLGLAIVKRIVELHEGQITANLSQGKITVLVKLRII